MTKIYRSPLVPSFQPRPIAPDCVRAGFPSPAQDYEESTLDINEYLIDNPPATFFFKLEGESMIEFGFQPGDVLVVDRALEPKDQNIVIAFVGGERLCKQLRIRQGVGYLVAGHPDFVPIKMTDDSLIWGVVTGRFAKVKGFTVELSRSSLFIKLGNWERFYNSEGLPTGG